MAIAALTGSHVPLEIGDTEEPEVLSPLELEPIEPEAEEAEDAADAAAAEMEAPGAPRGYGVPVATAQGNEDTQAHGAPAFLLDDDVVEADVGDSLATRTQEEIADPGASEVEYAAPTEESVPVAEEEPVSAAPAESRPVRPPLRIFERLREWAGAFQGAPGDRRPWYEWIALWGGGALAIVALALLVRAILPGILGKPRAPVQEAVMPLGTGANLDLFSDPPGAAVKIDGVPLGTRTPATDVAVAPGTHRVEMDWGLYGSRRDTVNVTLGGRVKLRPRLLGSVGFRSSDPSRVLDVFVDGAYAGSTPLALDSLVVGRHLIRFGGAGINSTAQEVEVLQGTHVELFGNAGPVPEKGSVTIRSALLTDTGYESGRGDPVWVDGEVRGVTPVTVELKPGAHSFRVLRRNFPPQISVLEVNPGGDQFITAEFGARSEDPLRFSPPTAISVSDPLPVSISLPEGEWDQSMALWLYAGPPGGSFQARRMTRLDSGSKLFAALVPVEVLRNSSRQVRLYFKGVGAAGRELYSEIYTIPVSN